MCPSILVQVVTRPSRYRRWPRAGRALLLASLVLVLAVAWVGGSAAQGERTKGTAPHAAGDGAFVTEWEEVHDPPASRFRFGLRVGGGAATLSYSESTPEGFDRSAIFSAVFGGDFRYQWRESLFLESGLHFVRLGGLEKGFEDEQIGGRETHLDYEIETVLTYLVVPLRIRLGEMGSHPRPYVRVGPNVAFCYNANREQTGNRIDGQGRHEAVHRKWTVKSSTNSLDVAAAAEVGVEGPFIRKTRLLLELGAIYGFLDASQGDDVSIRNRAVMVSAGIVF
ncbi:MAG: porin family protein [Candidatus Eisenbacteria bacterium]|uniref:PorT family protein n=1 Tax=Eiseniibacteriota bacterium TaxID=2212470 RepID=A0A956RPI1_UNCEI|nr:PorT family protein [Candidatus Eisenbacteria bacterium]